MRSQAHTALARRRRLAPSFAPSIVSMALAALTLAAACAEPAEALLDGSKFDPDKGYYLSSTVWQTHTVPVCWENSSSSTLALEATVRRAASTWASVADLRFVGWDDCTTGADGIHILWDDVGPYVTNLGDLLDGATDGMVLNPTFLTWSTDCQGYEDNCVYNGALHEFGHAIGIAHEHNRDDTPSSCTDAPQGADGDVTVGAWDANSVMNYCNSWYADTLRALSVGDVMTARTMYGMPRGMADFDGDTYADLAIGVPGDNAVNAIYGSTSGLGGVGSEYRHGTTGTGASLAIGDFNGDGFTDLAAGAPDAVVAGQSAAGLVDVWSGSSGGLSTSSEQLDQDILSQASAEANDGFGASLAAGDFDGDGRDDLAVGVPYEDVDGVTQAGLVHVVYGSSTGLSASDDEVWHQNTGGVPGGAEAGDFFGETLTAGDFDGDGYDDLAIGIPHEAIGSAFDAGAVQVLYGSEDGLTTSGTQMLVQGSGDIEGTPETGNRFGQALAVGDIDGDGYEDLAVGVPFEDIDSLTTVGIVQVIYGGDSGLQASDTVTQNTSGIKGSNESGDEFGAAVAIQDFDNDGYGDLIIGIPGEDIGSIDEAGRVAVIAGGVDGLTSADEDWHQDSSGILGGSEASDRFGAAVTAADFDGDGHADLAAGVPNEAISGIDFMGMVNVIPGTDGGALLTSSGNAVWHQDMGYIPGLGDTNDFFGSVLK